MSRKTFLTQTYKSSSPVSVEILTEFDDGFERNAYECLKEAMPTPPCSITSVEFALHPSETGRDVWAIIGVQDITQVHESNMSHETFNQIRACRLHLLFYSTETVDDGHSKTRDTAEVVNVDNPLTPVPDRIKALTYSLIVAPHVTAVIVGPERILVIVKYDFEGYQLLSDKGETSPPFPAEIQGLPVVVRVS